MRLRRVFLTLAAVALGLPTAAALPAHATAAPAWYGYHADPGHTGFSPGTPRYSGIRGRWHDVLDGAVYGQPLVVGGLVVVATENDTVYGLALSNGKAAWHVHLGSAVRQSTLPCGDIDPVGITSTPVYDPTTHRVFVTGLTVTGTKVAHVLTALDPAHGRVLLRRNVDVPGIDPRTMNQRGALTVSHGVVYVPYGGNAGDCGAYRGAVVGTREDGTGPLYRYVVPTPREAGIWAPGGIPVDAQGNLYVSIGNGEIGSGGGAYDGSDSVTKLSPTLRRLDLFAPAGWRAENDADKDLGSTAPLLVGPYVWIQGKSDTGYLLRQSHLGGVGHPFRTVTNACRSQFGGAASHGSSIFAPCTDGVRKISIGRDGSLHPSWRAPSGVTGSPVVGGGAVWSLDVGAGTLYAIGEGNGHVLGTAHVGAVSRFASPALVGPLVLVPTMTGISVLTGA